MSEPALPDEDELRAAELALDLLDGDERAEADARLARDPAFRTAHARWLGYAAAMIGGRAEPPRPSVWTAIAARLPANDAGAERHPERPWQVATAAASIAALLLAAVALDRPVPPEPRTIVVRQPAPPARTRTVYVDRPAPPAPPPRTIVVERPAPPPLIAIMTGDGDAAVAVSVDRASGQLTLAPARLSIGGKAAELWVIPAGDRPHSLGLVQASGAGRKAAAADVARYLVPGATLAISIEPPGGSPTGQPTGKVIVSGAVTTT